MEVKNIVILSTQRSGTTMVCDDFAGTGVLGLPTEYYHDLLSQQTEGLNKELVNSYLEKGKSPNGVRSVKIMANQLQKINKLYKDIGGNKYTRIFGSSKPHDYLYEQYKKALFVRVIRKDKIAQAVSLIFSQKTNVYHLFDGESKMNALIGKSTQNLDIRNVEFNYNAREIDDYLKWIENEEHRLTTFIEAYKIKPIIILYEEIIHSQKYLETISSELGIYKVKCKPRSIKKISGQNAAYWVNRYKKENALV